MIFHKGWTTHIPMLVEYIQKTKGPVLEIGSGPFSTPLIHWLTAEDRRRVDTYEAVNEYYQGARTFQSRTHKIHFVKNWDEIEFDKHYSVALIDNELERRQIEPIRLKDKVDYMVIHDTNREDYGYDKVWPYFKYRKDWTFCRPWTTVVSNFKKV